MEGLLVNFLRNFAKFPRFLGITSWHCYDINDLVGISRDAKVLRKVLLSYTRSPSISCAAGTSAGTPAASPSAGAAPAARAATAPRRGC